MISWLIFVLVVLLGQFSEGFVAVTGASSTVRATASPIRARTRETTRMLRLLSNPNLSHGSTTSTTSTSTSTSTQTKTTRFPPRGGASAPIAKPLPATPVQKSLSSTMTTTTSLFASASGEAPACPFTKFAAAFGSVWGTFGVIYILGKAISRVLPIAIEPLASESSLVLSPVQWSLYALSCVLFAYAEGYKGFHKKFAPLVVKRSFTLVIGTRQGNNPLNYLLAPFYSMGLWGATPRRRMVSWGVTIGVALLVAMVKKLPPGPRCILDAGVVVGLTVGSASILYYFVNSLVTGKLPDVNACLPRENAN